MTVPFSEAVARSVPVALRASAESGALCARMSWVTVRDFVEKRRTSPVGWVGGGEVGGGEGCVERGEGVGSGEG